MRRPGASVTWGSAVRVLLLAGCLSVTPATLRGQGTPDPAELALGPEDVLILVNGDSPVSHAVARMYRQYHPGINDWQVLKLYGLPDSAALDAGPVDEIITRDQFETLIAQPLRNYLIATGQVDSVYCIITTAGMPFRIEDSNPSFGQVICPPGESGCGYGSNASMAVGNRSTVDAATVEAELSVLFQIDPALPSPPRLPITNRLVNPYQAYKSPIKSWRNERNILGRRGQLRWTFLWRLSQGPLMEGLFGSGFVAKQRIMSPADIYLVARLDGPRHQGEYPLAAIKAMLDRSMAVSNPESPDFVGHASGMNAYVIDDSGTAPPDTYAYSEVLNYPPIPNSNNVYTLTHSAHPIPPDATDGDGNFNNWNHYDFAWYWHTGGYPPVGGAAWQYSYAGMQQYIYWNDTTLIMNQAQIGPGMSLLGLLTYGRNAGDGRPYNYLLASGPGGGELFTCAPGAVFSSLESFNGVTMFTDATPRLHALIAEFIDMGGSGAVGHTFEPERLALIQGDYLLRNWGRDDNVDGVGDLSFIEACYSAMPFVSWSEYVIGDPLMRLHTGLGGPAVAIDPSPQMIMAVSRLSHNQVDYDLPLYLHGQETGTVEPRLDGGSQVVVTFTEPIEAGGGEIVCGQNILPTGATCAGPVSGSGTFELTIALDTPNAGCVCLDFVGLTAMSDGVPVTAPPFCFGALLGDVNQSGGTNIADLSRVKAYLNVETDQSNFLADVNHDGGISLLDMSYIKSGLAGSINCE